MKKESQGYFEEAEWELTDRMFSEEYMYNFIEAAADRYAMKQTMAALPYAREKHKDQVRKGKTEIPYIVHPLLIACHALSLGLKADDLIAAILLHDVCEDCKDENGKSIRPEELPVGEEVQKAVRLVTKPETKSEGWEKRYYEGIKEHGLASVIKILDRCHNISTMADAFSKKKMAGYILETEEYVLPLLDMIQSTYEDISMQTVFLLKYQMLSLLGSLKRLVR